MVNIQYRSNLVSVINEVEAINLTTGHHIYLQQTPFWNLIFSILNSHMNIDSSKKSDVDVQKIIDTFDPQSKAFNLGGYQIRIREEEIRTMFGIEDGDQFIDLSKKSNRPTTQFVSRRFSGLQRIKKQNISDALRGAADEKTKIGRQDVARLLTLFCLATLFVPTKGHSISWSYITLVEDLEQIKQYNWSEHILDFLENSLCSTSRGTGVAGCIMMLPYWICEHTTLVQQSQNTGIPRCIVWDLRSLTNAFKNTKLNNLKQDQVICDEEQQHETNEQSDSGSEDNEPETASPSTKILSDDELLISDVLQILKSNRTGSDETASETVPGIQPAKLPEEAVKDTEEPETSQSIPVDQQTDPVTSVLESLNNEHIHDLEQQLKEKDEKIAALEQQIREKDDHITKQFLENEALNLENLKLKAEIESVNTTVELLRADIEEANVHEITQKTKRKARPSFKVPQALDSSEQPSMYKRLKGKTRQTKRDPQYTYSGKKKVTKKQKTATPAAETKYEESDIVDVDLLAEPQKDKRHSTKQIIATFEKNTHLSDLEKKRIRDLIDTDGQA